MIKFGEGKKWSISEDKLRFGKIRQELIEKIKKHAGLDITEDLSCLSADALDSIWHRMKHEEELEKMQLKVVSVGHIPVIRDEIIDEINRFCDIYDEDFSCISTGSLQKIYKALFPWQFRKLPY